MSSQIWRYELLGDRQEISMPSGAEVLTVQTKEGAPCIWARVDTEARRVVRKFRVFGTGQDMPDPSWEGQYVGTFQTKNGLFVWHLYEVHE